VLSITTEVRNLIAKNFSESQLARLAAKLGMHTLLESGIQKVQDGLTSLDEVFRVLGPQESSLHVCPKCGGHVEEGARYCHQCSEPLMLVCPSCSSVLESTWSYCTHCGHSLSDHIEGRGRSELAKGGDLNHFDNACEVI
jgi:rRNA maturation endonuclease Nob1